MNNEKREEERGWRRRRGKSQNTKKTYLKPARGEM
jgi:hypothetical protein